tara:strand:+ start:2022 stop:2888 length:867 start_codon:yes stop_codon:yes gene_type:complete
MNVLINFKTHKAGITARLTRHVEFLRIAEENNWTPYVNWIANDGWQENGQNLWPMLFKQNPKGKMQFDKIIDPDEFYRSIPNEDRIVRHNATKLEMLKIPGVQGLYPRNKNLANELILKYINPKKSIMEKIDKACAKHINPDKTLGVHCRGPGRLHGGVEEIHEYFGINGTPYDLYFKKIDQQLQYHEKIFLATDADSVRSTFKKRYGERVIWESHDLPTDGEAHSREHCKKVTPRAKKLFEMCLIDMYLLSKCDSFICGNSNVSLYTQCLNPNLITDCVYNYDMFKK